MGRKSSITRQAPTVREAIGRWHREHRTLDEILDALEESFGVTISRSALHRHVKGMDKTLARIERSRQIAEAAVARFGQEPESKVVRANIELMHAAISEILSFADEGAEADPDAAGGGVAKPMDAMLLAKALEHLTKASRHDAESILKIRERERVRVQEEMHKRVLALGSAQDIKALTDAELEQKIAELASNVSDA